MNLTPDFNVALTFINEYADFCEPKPSKTIDSTWIDLNPLLTENFKTRYKAIIDSAHHADPEAGLGYDPIFNAQDFDSSYTIKKADKIDGFVTVHGKNWKESVVEMKVIYWNNKWLVDGAGVINMPRH